MPQSLWALAYVHLFLRQYAQAQSYAQAAVDIAPGFADSYMTIAICKLHFGQPVDALKLIKKAMALNPRYPAAYASILGQTYYFLGKHELAEEALNDALQRNINLQIPYVFLMAVLSEEGRDADAAWAAAQFRALKPDFAVDEIAGMLPVSDEALIAELSTQIRKLGFD